MKKLWKEYLLLIGLFAVMKNNGFNLLNNYPK